MRAKVVEQYRRTWLGSERSACRLVRRQISREPVGCASHGQGVECGPRRCDDCIDVRLGPVRAARQCQMQREDRREPPDGARYVDRVAEAVAAVALEVEAKGVVAGPLV